MSGRHVNWVIGLDLSDAKVLEGRGERERVAVVRAHKRRSLLVALAWHANKRDRCWPSQDLLCRETSLAPRTLQRVLRTLVADGYVTVEYRLNRVSIYTLKFDSRSAMVADPSRHGGA